MKKTKTSKFLIAKNPMLNDAVIHLVHTRKPRFLAQVLPVLFADLPINLNENHYIIAFLNKEHYLYLYQIKIIDAIDNDNFGGVLARMGDWYTAYLANTGEKAYLLKDYNKKNQGLKCATHKIKKCGSLFF